MVSASPTGRPTASPTAQAVPTDRLTGSPTAQAVPAGRPAGSQRAPVAAAVLPHPPLLVPELAGAAAAELDLLRAACREALATVVAAAKLTVLVGDGPVWGVPAPGAPGSFHPYGAEVEVALPALVDRDLPDLPPPAQLTDLPLSLAVAAYLLDGLNPPPAQLYAVTVPRSLGPRAAARIGNVLASMGPFGLVVMADLSACRTEQAPGAFHAEAADLDAQVADAFRRGAPHHLLTLDPTRSADLLVAGRVPLQVLAGAFEPTAAASGEPPEAGGLGGRILYEDAPYGVGYLVALLMGPEQ